MIGNLPYNISTPLLFRLLEAGDAIIDMHFMLQKEVVDRIVAAPGSDAYGRLTVMLAPRVAAERVLDRGGRRLSPGPQGCLQRGASDGVFRRTPDWARSHALRRCRHRRPSGNGARPCATR